MSTDFTEEEYRNYIIECYRVAAAKSDDLSNQNAAMIISQDGDEGPIVPNKIPDRVFKHEERIKVRPTKYDFIEHAERGAIYAAAKKGICTEDAILICPWFACADCARSIICSGVKRVVGHKQRNELTSYGRNKIVDTVSDRWVNPISNGDLMLKEAGIELIYLDFEAGIRILINEQLLKV